MQITITEDEIKEAIRNHMLNQIHVKEDMTIEIDLKATRGDAGYTALIDISPSRKTAAKAETKPAPKAADKPVEKQEKPAPTKAKEAAPEPSLKAEVQPEPEPIEEPELEPVEDKDDSNVVVLETAKEEPAADPAPEAEVKAEVAPAPAPKSIFAGLKKPVNTPTS